MHPLLNNIDYLDDVDRLSQVQSYTHAVKENDAYLQEVTELASTICGMPISLISIVGDQEQEFMSKTGLDIDGTPIEDSFCKYVVMDQVDELFVVEDALEDERFKSNRLVLGEPSIRFYAGAPLVTPNGDYLGSLCVIDKQKNLLTPEQQNSLKLLARNVMRYLNEKATVNKQNEEILGYKKSLEQLSNESTGALFQAMYTQSDGVKITFMSKGLYGLHPTLSPSMVMEDMGSWFSQMSAEDANRIKKAFTNCAERDTYLNEEYIFSDVDGSEYWYRVTAKGEPMQDGSYLIHGSITDISVYRRYENALEQIVYDLSHVLRRPLANILGLTNLIEEGEDELTPDLLKIYASQLSEVSNELDQFIYQLDSNYNETREKARYLLLASDPTLWNATSNKKEV